jgi:hypothetical protein
MGRKIAQSGHPVTESIERKRYGDTNKYICSWHGSQFPLRSHGPGTGRGHLRRNPDLTITRMNMYSLKARLTISSSPSRTWDWPLRPASVSRPLRPASPASSAGSATSASPAAAASCPSTSGSSSRPGPGWAGGDLMNQFRKEIHKLIQ